MVLEVAPRAGVEGVLAHPRDQLLEHGGPLGVGDAVEVGLGGRHVGDVRGDGVRGGHLVLLVGPGLAVHRETRPLPPVAGRGGSGCGALVLREGLLEPQVVPPRGGHQVPEPHVAHLVQDRVGAALALGEGGGRARQVGLVEGHAAGVLHGAQVVLGHEHLVVGAPRVGGPVARVVEVQARAGHLQDVVGVDEGLQRLAAHEPQSQIRVPAVGRAALPVAAVDDRPRARDEGCDVAGQGRCRTEVVAHRVRGPGQLLGGVQGPVGGDDPPHRGGDVEGPPGLDVGLVDAGPRPVGVVGLELRVQVDQPVLGVLVAVQPLARARVPAAGVDLDLDGGARGNAVDPDAVLLRGEGAVLPVDPHGVHPAGHVDEQAGDGGGEREARCDGVVLAGEFRRAGDIHRDVDGGELNVPTSVRCFVA